MHWIIHMRGKLAASAFAMPCGSSNADLVDAAAASAAAAPEEMPVSYTHLTLPTTPYV